MAYGNSYIQWFFKAELIQEYDPINSYGNGSGMRVSPVAYYFDTLEETMRFAKISADVTHNLPEGEKGAIAEAYYGEIPQYIKDFCLTKTPDDAKDLIKKFYKTIKLDF